MEDTRSREVALKPIDFPESANLSPDSLLCGKLSFPVHWDVNTLIDCSWMG